MKAKVAYTYKWTDREIREMPFKIFYQYWLAIAPLEAEDMLRGFKVSVYPHLKPQKAKELFNRIKLIITKSINKTGGKLADYNSVMAKLQGAVKRGK